MKGAGRFSSASRWAGLGYALTLLARPAAPRCERRAVLDSGARAGMFGSEKPFAERATAGRMSNSRLRPAFVG